MCGIAGFFLRDMDLKVDRDALLTELLDGIEERGKDATGFVAITDEGVGEWQKASCKASVFNYYRRGVPKDARAVIGHTRWATQGLPAFMENNHPIKRGPFFIIHNGHVNNDDDLFIEAERNRFGEVDSEAIAARLSSLGDLSELGKVMAEIRGNAAVAAVDERDASRIALARGQSSPLYVYNGRKIVVFASTEKAVVTAHQKHVGGMKVDRLWTIPEGKLLEWKGREFSESKFEVLRPKYEPREWTYAGYSGGSSGSHSTGQRKSQSDTKGMELVRRNEYNVSAWTTDCENCGTTIAIGEEEFRWDGEAGFSWKLCDDCAEVWDEEEDAGRDPKDSEKLLDRMSHLYSGVDGEQTIIDGEIILSSTQSSPSLHDQHAIDDYAGANESVVNRLKNFLL